VVLVVVRKRHIMRKLRVSVYGPACVQYEIIIGSKQSVQAKGEALSIMI